MSLTLEMEILFKKKLKVMKKDFCHFLQLYETKLFQFPNLEFGMKSLAEKFPNKNNLIWEDLPFQFRITLDNC